ncbi:hypothetical protein N7539_001758 [Penicillium diatomitis]|uniref:Zn(2)-C6 fungal-type domain-containing protein n=1 Tax=Penicillium diatomitis TaxID=2819901 RepID=A0A9X0BZZ2_9EURO|nr:uncharacterized protein N7539_001758 [Penicillium diatomitis]KAJ5493012.1 hypothetical protein N7539_001758 [Penicillium diatomitis]
MLFMQNSPYLTRPHFDGSGSELEACAGPSSEISISTLADITNATVSAHRNIPRASTSSTSTSGSPDDTSSGSPDWPGDSADRTINDYDAPYSSYRLSSRPDPASAATPGMSAPYDSDQLPKIEELDENEDDIHRIKSSEVGAQGQSTTAAPVAVPRKRGRPRKHPLPTPGGQAKVTKGRSKTGCITCRRRKKKCDETKPACLNCQKNAVVCEGYPPKEIWKSGRQRMADAARSHSTAIVPRGLPLLIDGIETEIDRRFLDHFVYGFSRVLTLINDDSNPFKEILLPMATQHRGLMHSLMCLSGSHLSGIDPEPKLKERKYHHFHRAIQDLKENITAKSSQSSMATESSTKTGSETKQDELLVEDPIIASTIALSLNTICEGETSGEYRPHMDAARYLLTSQQPRNEKFRQFIVEFFQYHDISNALTSLDRRPALLQSDLRLPDFVPGAQAGNFLGVFDGLFNYISQITQLRDRIRERHSQGYEPAVDYQTLSEAVQIDTAIRTWRTSHEKETPNWYLAQLYRQSTWVYLYRTIRPSRPSDKISQVVEDGLVYLDLLPQDASAYSIVLMPLFLLGCSAFVPAQRERITRGFDTLRSYSNLRNIEPAFKVVSRVWQVMDSHIEESWDWEKIIKDMDMDFLIT